MNDRIVTPDGCHDVRPVTTDDFVAIQRLVHRYSDAIVHRNRPQWQSCWADNASWEIRKSRTVQGVDAIVAVWMKGMSRMAAIVQTVENGDAWHPHGADDLAAAGRWYVTETYSRFVDSSSGIRIREPGIVRAHYDDTYVRQDGGWRFANRMLNVLYHGPPDLSGEFTDAAEP